MIRMLLRPLLATALLALPAQAQLQLKPCTFSKVIGQCGKFVVSEGRVQPNGRKLELAVVVLPPANAASTEAPLLILDGGPGSAATQLTDFVVTGLAPVRAKRAIILIDQRGTGDSNPLSCEPAEQHFVVPRDPSACLKRLSSRADLSKYGTLNFVRDLEELRQALGYRQLHLYGASYGSRVAQMYLREHPDVVRSIVLVAPAPMSLIVPDGVDAGSEKALAHSIKDCHSNAACAQAFPELQTLPAGLDDFTRMGLHFLMYSPETARRVPWLLAQTAAGRTRIVRWDLEKARRMLSNSISLGLHLTVICSEDLPFAKESAGPFAGEYRQACRDWPRFPVPANLHEPVRSKVPVLLLAGEHDPVTGPNRAEELRQYFPNAQLVVVPGGGHMFGGFSGCLDRNIARFLEGQALERACVTKLAEPEFFLGN